MKVKEIIRALETHLKEAPSRPTHLDIKADHIFFDDSRVIFIDMDIFGLGVLCLTRRASWHAGGSAQYIICVPLDGPDSRACI